MSHNVCYCNKIKRPQSSTIFDNGRWNVAVGDLVYGRVLNSTPKGLRFSWHIGEVNSLSRDGLIDIYFPALGRRLLYDVALYHKEGYLKKCFDAVLCDGDIVRVGDSVSEVDDLYHLNYKVLRIDGERLLCRHVSPHGSDKYPSIWFHVHEVEKIENEK